MCTIILESIVLGIYLCLKIFFLIDTNVKMWTEIIDLVVLGRNYWSSCRVKGERVPAQAGSSHSAEIPVLATWFFFQKKKSFGNISKLKRDFHDCIPWKQFTVKIFMQINWTLLVILVSPYCLVCWVCGSGSFYLSAAQRQYISVCSQAEGRSD